MAVVAKKMKEINFAIHDLNQTGGQDRSTLEIISRLAKDLPIKIHAFTLSDSKLNNIFHPVKPNIRRPVLIKSIYFYLILFLRELFAKKNNEILWHTTGVSHFKSHFVHVQFIHKSWRKHKIRKHSALPSRIYHEGLELFNVVLENLCFREGKIYIALSNSVASDLRADFGIKENIYVIPHGVDVEKFKPLSIVEKMSSKTRASFKLKEGQLAGLFVGSFERKGLATTINAIHALDAAVRNKTKIIVVGDGNFDYYNSLIRKLNLEESIVLLPKSSSIIDYFQAADYFILPTTYEPFGLVILEALACGLPVIVSKCAGASELIRDTEEGFIINNPADAQELALLIKQILTSKEKISNMAIAARKLAEKHTWDLVASKYKKLLAQHLRN